MIDQTALDRLAESTHFSGVVVVEEDGQRTAAVTAGMANRALEIPIDLETRFGTASATKGFTALTAVSLIESGELQFDTRLTSLAGAALSCIDPEVTIEQLLGHTSGVGDYLDEETLGDIDDHILGGFSAHRFERPHHYLPLLNQYPQVAPPGTRFVYNNGGYIMLSLAIERAGGRTFHQLVEQRVFLPAGMEATGFFRSDDLPGQAALGYLQNGRTNVFHLPVVGGGDGGAYTTASDMSRFWAAFLDGQIVSPGMVKKMVAPSELSMAGPEHYGLGFWIGADGKTVMLEGMDPGVSFQSAYHPPSRLGFTVLSNTSSGTWPVAAELRAALAARTAS